MQNNTDYYKVNKYCDKCKKTFNKEGHFIPFIQKSGHIHLKCKIFEENKIVEEKPKRKICRHCGRKTYDLDHFTEITTIEGHKKLICETEEEYKKTKIPKIRKKREKYVVESNRFIVDKKEWMRNYNLFTKYGIDIHGYNKIFEEQKGCCAICGKHQMEFNKNLAVDHDHKTDKVRGLLCDNCNHGIGNFRDDIEMIKKVILYLQKELLIDGVSYKYGGRYNRMDIKAFDTLLEIQNYSCKICNLHKDNFKKVFM